MPLNDSALIVAANALRADITHIQGHTAAPNAAGTTNLVSGARQPVTWGAATGDGDFSNSAAINFTGVAASGAFTHISYFTALTAGTCRGSDALTGDQTANAAGEYQIAAGALTINGSHP